MKQLGRVGALGVALVALLVLVGWYADIAILTTWHRGYVPMRPITAVCLLLLGLGIAWSGRRQPALALSAAVAALASGELAEAVIGRSLGLAHLLPGLGLSSSQARMASATSACLLLLSAALALLVQGRPPVMHVLAKLAFVVGLLALLGYAYGVSTLYSLGNYTSMAFHTGLAICVLSVALMVQDPDHSLIGLLTDRGSAGRLLRPLLPALLLGPALLGWARLQAQERGWIDNRLGISLFAVAMSALGTAIAWRAALTMRSLDRDRDAAEDQLRQVNLSLERVVDERTRALARTADQLGALIQEAPVGIVKIGTDGGVEDVNDQWAVMTGLTTEQAKGMSWLAAVHPDDVADVSRAWTELVRTGDRIELTLRLVQPRGDVRWVQARTSPVIDDGVLTGHLGTFSDVTDLRLAQEEAAEARSRTEVMSSRLRAVLDNMPAMLGYWDRDLRSRMANNAYVEWFGFTPEQMHGRHIREVIGEDLYAANEPYMRRALAGELQVFERAITDTNGVKRFTQASYIPDRRDGEVHGFFVQVVDITANKRTEQALEQALKDVEAEQERLLEAQRLGQLGSFEQHLATGTWTASEQLGHLLGLPTGVADRPALDAVVVAEDRARLDACWAAALGEPGPHEAELRIHRANDGIERFLRLTVEAEPDSDGHPARLRGTFVDVTDVTLARRAAEEDAALRDAVLTASPDYTFVTDLRTGALVFGSPGKQILGITTDELEALGPAAAKKLIHPDDLERLQTVNTAAADLEPGEVLEIRYRARHADGSWHWLHRRATPFRRDAAGRVTEVLGVVRDVTDVVEAEAKLSHAALHDNLTGLPNRALLVDRLEASLTRSEREGREVSVLFCDLDGFKRVNDTAGHAAGDVVLLETARRIQHVLREGDTVARIGGDEFIVVIEPWNRGPKDFPPGQDGDRASAAEIAGRITEAVRQPITVDGTEHLVSASIGIAYSSLVSDGRAHPSAVAAAQELLQQADAAMYRAKKLGKDRYEVFEHGMRARLAERKRVERLLVQLLPDAPGSSVRRLPVPRPAAQGLSAHFQPVFRLETGELTGFEALARLTDADGRPVPPEVFVPVAEEVGLMRPLCQWMLATACGQLAAWHAGHPELGRPTVAVNVSALQVQHPSLAADVHEALRVSGLSPSDLVLELTESALLHAAHSTITTLEGLRAEGVGVAIDDFGTGFGSLRFLATLPVSAVKIDRSFTAGLPADGTSRKIVNAVARLAADLNLTCVVEGVETEEQRAALPGGVHIQGYLTGGPRSPEAMFVGAVSASAGRDAGGSAS